MATVNMESTPGETVPDGAPGVLAFGVIHPWLVDFRMS